MTTALITGITGQDGSYLAELLLKEGYDVLGLVRRSSNNNLGRIAHIQDKITLLQGDLLDQSSLDKIILEHLPDEVYNLGAQSFVATSWDQPVYTADVTGLGVIRLLESLIEHCPDARLYQASSSEMFGSSPPPQNEQTPFHPRSPYAVAKVLAYHATVNYRESFGLHASNGILFNHESPRRGPEFVTKKITQAVARIYLGLQKDLHLGNLDAHRDWGYAGDYVKAMWIMLQMDKPGDYVIATGESHSVREFVDMAFSCVGLDWEQYVVQDPALMRPADVPYLQGDPAKAHNDLGWTHEVCLQELVNLMVMSDIRHTEASK